MHLQIAKRFRSSVLSTVTCLSYSRILFVHIRLRNEVQPNLAFFYFSEEQLHFWNCPFGMAELIRTPKWAYPLKKKKTCWKANVIFQHIPSISRELVSFQGVPHNPVKRAQEAENGGPVEPEKPPEKRWGRPIWTWQIYGFWYSNFERQMEWVFDQGKGEVFFGSEKNSQVVLV